VTLFDEPYLGLDAVERQLFYDRLIADYAEQPRTVVLSTHLIEEIAGLLEHVLLIDHGRVLLDADGESLRNSAVTVTGPGDKVHAFERHHELLHTGSLGGHSRAIVRTHGPLTARWRRPRASAWSPPTCSNSSSR
jgi:ABC-2 type transport system ATP-binding protein